MKPLEHITILDLSRVLACPFASMILAELGATVIKVEQPDGGDETRSFEPFAGDGDTAVSGYYLALNRSKQSITVNLRKPAGQQIIRDLAAKADVLLENFPVGNLKRYGLDYPALRQVNPQLIYLSCTGFGQTGPYSARKGYDTVFQAMGGIMSLTGERGGGPVKPGLPVADLTSGLWVAIALLAAVEGRHHSGTGCHVDFSMLDGQVSLLTIAAARYFALGEVPPRLGTEHPGRVPTASFRCVDGGWLHITASDQHWQPLCQVLGLAEWGSDPDLQENAGRVARREAVMARLSQAIAGWKRGKLSQALDAVGVPAGPVLALDEVMADPHVKARGLVQDFDYPGLGHFPALGLPYKFDGFEAPRAGIPPTLGQHTEAVLRDRLGLTPEQIATLRQEQAI